MNKTKTAESDALKHVGFVDVRLTWRRMEAVYLIDNVYIGVATHLRRRIISHVLDSLAHRHANKALQAHMLSKIDTNEPIQIRVLSRERHDEDALIQEYRANGYALFNSPSFGRTLKRPDPV